MMRKKKSKATSRYTTRQQQLQQQHKKVVANNQLVDVSGQMATAGYRAVPHIWFSRPIDLPPFSFQMIRGMLLDPGVKLNFATRAAPIAGAEFGYQVPDPMGGEAQWVEGVKCAQPEIAAYVYRQIQTIWKNYLPEILRAQIWGWSSGEITFKLSDSQQIEINSLQGRHASDCRLLKNPDTHERVGVSVSRVEGAGTVTLPFPYGWFHAYNAEDGDDYGVSAAIGAYSPWADKAFNGGALDVRRLFMHKDAYGGVDIAYPEGDTFVNGINQLVPNSQLAQSIAEQATAGGITTRPSHRDENGNEKWVITRATVPGNPSHILQYPKDLDDEIRHGMEIADDVISADGSGAWAGKRVTIAAFYASLDHWIVQIIRDLKEQVINHLLLWNFGHVPEYEICHKPLAKQVMEQQANAGPGQGEQPGQEQMQAPGEQQPPGMQQQPQAPQVMSLLASGDLSAAALIESAKAVTLRMSLNKDDDKEQDEDIDESSDNRAFAFDEHRIEMIADLLSSIYGDKAEEMLDALLSDAPKKLALWSPDDHPRGKDGRFIAKGSPEAFRVAKEKVQQAHAEKSPESMKALMDHMNTLSISQLHQLKRDYGTKGSAKTKAALIEKLSGRLVSGRHRLARRDDDTPVAPVNEEVYSVPTSSLNVDPARFQYKVTGIGEKGVGEELKGTSKWSPDLGGVLLVWRDPENGKDYVVNGHHRHELAERTNAPQLNVRYIDATNARAARATGALNNIAQGRGSALDAAKYLRDSDRDIDHLRDAGISMSGKVASEAVILTRLGQKAFQAVAEGRLDEGKAIAVAKHLQDHDLQDKLFKKLSAREDDGKEWSDREIETAAKKMAKAGTVKQSGSDLFGDWENEESTFDQEVEIESYINKALATEANDFAAVSSTRRAERVAETGNVLNVDANLQKRDSTRSALGDFERESGLKGPVAEAIKTHAARLATAKKKQDKDAIKRESLEEVRRVMAEASKPVEKPGLEFAKPAENESAKSGDQLGLFGEVANTPKPAPTLDHVGETKGRSVGLFETDGDPDQMLLFDDGVETADRTWNMDEDKKKNKYSGALAMSVSTQYGPNKGEHHLTDEEAEEVEGNTRELLRSLREENQALRMALDKVGHDHKSKGPGGGQFVKKGSGGNGGGNQQPANKAPSTPPAKAAPAPAQAPVPKQQQQAPQPATPPAPAQQQPQQQQQAPLPNPAGKDSFEQHQSPGGGFSADRQALHKQIIDSHFQGKTPVQNPVAYVLGGGPASGKSSIVNAGHVGMDQNTVHVDSDAIKGLLPEYVAGIAAKDHNAANHVHEESSYIAKLIQDKASKGGYNSLLDGTGDSSYEGLAAKVKKMREAGQKVVAHYVSVPTEMAISRNIERAKKTGRLPPESMLRACHRGVSQIVPQAAQNSLFDEFTLWDTTDGVVKVASQSPGSKLQVHDPHLWDTFIAKGKE